MLGVMVGGEIAKEEQTKDGVEKRWIEEAVMHIG